MKMKKQRFAIWTLSVVLLAGCGAYKVHPGSAGYTGTGTATAAQTISSHAYDTLLGADAVLQQTSLDFMANKFPAAAMPTIRAAYNDAAVAYNTANVSWRAFNDAATRDPSVSHAALDAAIAGVNAAITNLTNVKGGS
jgi:hypothetical protein